MNKDKLRRLHARVQELEEQTAHMADLVDQANYAHQKMKEAQARVRELEAAQAQRVPLSDAEVIGRISMQQFNADKAKQRVSQARDCQRPECMSRGCFGYCMKRITQEKQG